MGVLSCVARVCLVVINIIFLLIGLAIAAVGFVLRFGKTIWEPVLRQGISALKKVGDDTQILQNLDTDNLDLGQLISGLAIGLIVGGLVLCVLSLLGCCGACYKFNVVLSVYIIVIAVFIIGEAVAIGILYGKPEIPKNQLKKNSLNDYKGLGSVEVLSLGWNIIMMTFDCCGVENYEDFSLTTGWDRTLNGQLSGTQELLTPIACCKSLPTSPNAYSCAQSPFNASKNNGEMGCYDKIWSLSFGNTAIVIPVLIVCGLIQIAFIIFAVIIIKFGKDSISPS